MSIKRPIKDYTQIFAVKCLSIMVLLCMLCLYRRDKSIEAYRAEVSCMSRLRTEIIHLRALVSSQQDLITKLASENKSMRREKFALRRHEIIKFAVIRR